MRVLLPTYVGETAWEWENNFLLSQWATRPPNLLGGKGVPQLRSIVPTKTKFVKRNNHPQSCSGKTVSQYGSKKRLFDRSPPTCVEKRCPKLISFGFFLRWNNHPQHYRMSSPNWKVHGIQKKCFRQSTYMFGVRVSQRERQTTPNYPGWNLCAWIVYVMMVVVVVFIIFFVVYVNIWIKIYSCVPYFTNMFVK